MRGRKNPQITMLAFIDLEERVPAAHPVRTVKRLADEALADLSSTFDRMYAKGGRPTPERAASGPSRLARAIAPTPERAPSRL